ncbi:Uncharacterised protein [Yersinia enterocolitica]|nr:Uncharacterised protein [Yersinia enterocolitica]
MAVGQNDFRYLMSGQLTGTTQAQHVFGVLPLTQVTNLRLTGKERLKTFTLQAFEDGDGRDVGITV